jgi:hypothetical protein
MQRSSALEKWKECKVPRSTIPCKRNLKFPCLIANWSFGHYVLPLRPWHTLQEYSKRLLVSSWIMGNPSEGSIRTVCFRCTACRFKGWFLAACIWCIWCQYDASKLKPCRMHVLEACIFEDLLKLWKQSRVRESDPTDIVLQLLGKSDDWFYFM